MNIPLPPIAQWLPVRRLGRLGIAALLLLVFAGVSAQAAIRAIIASRDLPAAAAPRAQGYEAEDHFPGAAYLYVADQDAAPMAGTTGTAALPDLPVPPEAAAATPDLSVRAAQPFSMRFASGIDRARALQCLTTAIYYEAATEPDAGQQAVAQVILNRVRHPAFPNTVCGVIYQGSERTTGCQFSYACDGAMARAPSRGPWERAARVAAAALAGYVAAPVGLATHYHTYAVTPSWNRSLVMTAAIGAHFFHRWQGYWGTPGAFHQRYRGGEPFPGPHPRAAPPAIPPLVMAALRPAPGGTVALATQIQPRHAATGSVETPAPDNMLPPESQILDRWKDSGKPLR